MTQKADCSGVDLNASPPRPKLIASINGFPTWELVGGQVITHVHSGSVCSPASCCIHRPSMHHMREWTQHYSKDLGMGRICPHGELHPDPDEWTKPKHDCECRCCDPWTPEQYHARTKAAIDGLLGIRRQLETLEDA